MPSICHVIYSPTPRGASGAHRYRVAAGGHSAASHRLKQSRLRFWEASMFTRILCADDGSERAFRALSLAIAIAKAAGAELHMVSVEEIDYMPEFIEEIRE
jgi:Universal stress protein family